jgi:hypothetical protein
MGRTNRLGVLAIAAGVASGCAGMARAESSGAASVDGIVAGEGLLSPQTREFLRRMDETSLNLKTVQPHSPGVSNGVSDWWKDVVLTPEHPRPPGVSDPDTGLWEAFINGFHFYVHLLTCLMVGGIAAVIEQVRVWENQTKLWLAVFGVGAIFGLKHLWHELA